MIDPIPWDDFKSKFRWKQGEHVAAVAPTGAGKTTLLAELMPYRNYNIMFGTKSADPMYNKILRNGYKRVDTIDEIKPWDKKILLWPHHSKTIQETARLQQQVFRDAMDMVVKQKAWTVWVDEAKYLAEFLRLNRELTFMMEQLRSMNATIICGAQRPAWLPRSVLLNSTHVFLWKTTDIEDAKRLGDIGGINKKEVMAEAQALGKHEFIYIRTRGTESHLVRSQVRR